MSNLQYKLLENYDKNSEEYKNLVSSLKDLEQIQTNLHSVLLDQNNKLKNVKNTNDNIYDNLNNANINLKYCDDLHFSYKPIIIGSLIGALFISPVNALIGMKYFGLTTSIGGIVGGIGGYKIQKN